MLLYRIVLLHILVLLFPTRHPQQESQQQTKPLQAMNARLFSDERESVGRHAEEQQASLQQRQPVLTGTRLDAPTDTSRAWLNLHPKTWPDCVVLSRTSLGKTRGDGGTQKRVRTLRTEHQLSLKIMHLPPASYVRPSRSSLSFGLGLLVGTHKGASFILSKTLRVSFGSCYRPVV